MGEAPDELRADIEETRARMGERADALAYKADVPARSREKVHDVTDRIKEKVTGMTHSVGTTTSSAAGSVGDRAHGVKDTVSDRAHGVAHGVSSKAHDASARVGEGAHRAKGLAESNPLGLALGSVAAGFIAGLLVPVSRWEDQNLGPAADQLREKVSEVGQEAADRARAAVHSAEEAAREEISSSS